MRLVAIRPTAEAAAVLLVQGRNPLIEHCGLMLIQDGQPYVLHVQHAKKNEAGGGLLLEPVGDFLRGRPILKATHWRITPEKVRAYYEANKTRSYDVFSYNCEQMLSELLVGKKISPQLAETRNEAIGVSIAVAIAALLV